MKNSSYYIAPVGDWTHDLPHTVASNMVKVSHALNGLPLGHAGGDMYKKGDHNMYKKGDHTVQF